MARDDTTGEAATVKASADFLDRAVRALRDHLGSRLQAVALYGSWARGEARTDSDVDLFVVAHDLPRDRLERARYVHEPLAGCLSPSVSILAKTPEEFEGHFPALYLDIGLDGRILYDPTGYLAGRLARIREIIAAVGLRRERYQGELMWLWQRQPRPGWSLDWEGLHELPS